jgi:hypothetical protein
MIVVMIVLRVTSVTVTAMTVVMIAVIAVALARGRRQAARTVTEAALVRARLLPVVTTRIGVEALMIVMMTADARLLPVVTWMTGVEAMMTAATTVVPLVMTMIAVVTTARMIGLTIGPRAPRTASLLAILGERAAKCRRL